MPDLLFEIGTEELPPGLIPNLVNQVKTNILYALKENNINVNDKELRTFHTPRRLAIYIAKLPINQDTKKLEIKGPLAEKAFNDKGQPAQALEGFLKRNNIQVKDINIKKINNIEYVFAEVISGGQKTLEILKNILPTSIGKTTGEKFMSWGNYDKKFSRPIRWLLALFDNEVIDFTYCNLKSNRYTFGHRFLSKNKIQINSPGDYEISLEKNYVIPCPEKRKEKIIKMVTSIKDDNDALIGENLTPLLDLLAYITEYPSALVCAFNTKFLTLPEVIIETVLAKHQKFIGLFNKNTKKILPNYIVVTNSTETINNNIQEAKAGFEKVVQARLTDAEFFYKEDLKLPFNFESKSKHLEKITFQKGMGSILDKVKRITKVSECIYELLKSQNVNKINKDDLILTAKLCKLDLTSHMVFELPELQGNIGSIYATKNNYNENVSIGIKEHYKVCPSNDYSLITGISDKLDNVICFISLGKSPKGSGDPFALRKQAQGIIESILYIHNKYKIINDKITINLSTLIDFFKKEFFKSDTSSLITNEKEAHIRDFLLERFKQIMRFKGYEVDIIESVFATADPLSDICQAEKKINILSNIFLSPSNESRLFLTAAKRLIRIVEPSINGNIEINLLVTDYEKQLFSKFDELSKKNYSSYNNFLDELTTLTNPINTFFDKVLVNDPDPKIKQTRQSLLKKGKDLFEKICDFNKIQERKPLQ